MTLRFKYCLNNEKKKLKLVVDTDEAKCYDIKVVTETTTTTKVRNAIQILYK